MATIKSDTFTEASDTALESHSSDVGGSWAAADTGHFDIIAADDEVQNDGSDNRWAAGDEDPSSADYYCEINGRTNGASGNNIGAAVRHDGGTSVNVDCYFLNLRGNGTWVLYKVINGSFTTLDDDSYSVTSTTYYDVKSQAVGTLIKGFIDSIEVTSVADSDISAAGNVSFYSRGTNARVTSLFSEDIAVGVTGKSNPLSGPFGGPLAGPIG